MIAGYNSHLYKRFGFSISKLVVLFDLMLSAPELCSVELELWNKAVMRAIEKQRRREDLSICGFACEVLSKYQNKYGFELCGVLRLLRSMREEPAEHEEEWKLWRNAWERARSGECLGWIDYIYVEKES